jgi:hypothetical protein
MLAILRIIIGTGGTHIISIIIVLNIVEVLVRRVGHWWQVVFERITVYL